MIIATHLLERTPPRPALHLVCAWCEKPADERTEQPVSHGICRECAQQFFGFDPEQPKPA